MIHRVHASSLFIRLLCLLLGCAFARGARADVAVLVPPHVEQLPSGDTLEQANEELTRLLKLRGFDVISAGQSGPAAEAEQQRGVFPQSYDPLYCVTPECASEYRKLFDAIFAVQLMIASRGQKPSSVTIVLTESPKAFFSGTAVVEGRDVRAAVRSAFETARQKEEEGAGPWLTVQGTPEGAQVLLDGAEYGKVPFTKRHVESGAHKLEIKDEAYLVEQRSLNIPGKIDHVEVVNVKLEPLDRSALGNEGKRRSFHVHRSAWDYVLGGAVAGFGVVNLVAGIVQKTHEGDCSKSDESGCLRRYDSNSSKHNLMIGLGAAGIALGTTVIALGPIGQLQFRAGGDRAMLQLKGKF